MMFWRLNFSWGRAMFRSIIVTALFFVPAAVYANEMPALPDLPPLPTDYVSIGSVGGPYVGLLGGPTVGPLRGGVSALAGYSWVGDDTFLALEGTVQGYFDETGSIDVGLRGGLLLDQSVEVGGLVALGLHSTEGTYVRVAPSVQFKVSEGASARLQVQHDIDLSGDPGRTSVMSGMVFRF